LNPARNKKIKLMWEDVTLVGQYAVSPVNIEINGSMVIWDFLMIYYAF